MLGNLFLKVIKSLTLTGDVKTIFKLQYVNATYYGKTIHHFKVWICEYLGILHLIEKKVKIDNNKLTAIQ